MAGSSPWTTSRWCRDRLRSSGAWRISPPAGAEAAIGQVLAPFYLLVDADTGVTAEGAAPLLAAVEAGEADLAIGRLPALPGGGLGLVKDMAGWLIWRACGFRARAPMSGQRAATRDVIESCRPLASGFG